MDRSTQKRDIDTYSFKFDSNNNNYIAEYQNETTEISLNEMMLFLT